MFGIKKEKKGKKYQYTLLVNSSYAFLKFEDEAMETALYENIYTGKIVRFNIADGTICPV